MNSQYNKTGPLILTLFFTLVLILSSEASAECRTQGRSNFSIPKGYGMDSYRVSDGGGCGIGYRSGGGTSFTSVKIVDMPTNGTLVQNGAFHFRYKPKRGFVGEDNFKINICGDYQGKNGCVTNNYKVKVESK